MVCGLQVVVCGLWVMVCGLYAIVCVYVSFCFCFVLVFVVHAFWVEVCTFMLASAVTPKLQQWLITHIIICVLCQMSVYMRVCICVCVHACV